MKRVMIPFALLFIATAAAAQAPHEEWRTVATENFRVHYPEPWEEWALRATSRLESTRERVAAAVGYDPDDPIEVVVMDPAATANATALPLLGRPKIILWTTPPDALSAIGDSRDWQELLLVHETAHILHLNRPSRNTLDRFLERFVPIGPVARAPRWVSEGYATVIEGDLTGSGRPYRDFRAAVLRTWAIEGKLPSYGQLANDNRSFLGMSMAYLVGSAYLEWLRDRTHPDALVDVWRRMSAVQDRSFEGAFAGVFGDSPQDLYAIFRAELIQKSRNLSDEMQSDLREGELILDLSRDTSPLAVSPDGSHIAAVLRPRNDPSSIVIWETAPDDEAVTKRAELVEKMLERDPDDVAPVDPPALPRKRAHTLTLSRGANVESMTFTGDGLTLAYTSNHPDDDSVLHSELHVWNPESGNVRRVTDRGDVFSISAADPQTIVAVRHRHGKSGLVRIDLTTGAESVLVAPRLEPLLIDVAASGDRLAWTERDGGDWSVVLASSDANIIRRIPAPDAALVGDIAWGGENLYAAVGLGGFIELASLDPSTGVWLDLTRTTGAILSPAPAGEWIYFLDLDPDGLDVRRISPSGDSSDPRLRPYDERYAPIVRRSWNDAPPEALDPRDIPSSEPYGFGPRSWGTIFGGNGSSHGHLFEAGLRSSDPIGRFDLLLAGGWSEDYERGALLDLTWRGAPVDLGAGVWHWRPVENADDRVGIAMKVGDVFRARNRALSFRLTGGWEDLGEAGDSGVAAMAETAGALRSDLFGIDSTARYSIGALHSEARDSTSTRGALTLSAHRGSFGISYRESLGDSNRADTFRIGGLASTILPAFERVTLVEVPALATDSLVADGFRDQRAALQLPVIPGELFARRITPETGEAIELAGWTLTMGIDRMPIIGIPSLELEVGAAYRFDAPVDDDEVTWWIGTRWSID